MQPSESPNRAGAPHENPSTEPEIDASPADSRSSPNAIEHGVRSPEPVVEGLETLEDWLAHRETVVAELIPVGQLETLYAERAALYLWRLNRVVRFETTATQFDLVDLTHEILVSLNQPELARDRSEAVLLEKLREPLEKYLREFSRWGAEAAKLPDQQEGLKKVRRETRRLKERRVLPDQATIQTIIKYESHLNRCLTSTMSELRRLQKERRRRLGEVKIDSTDPSKPDRTARSAQPKIHDLTPEPAISQEVPGDVLCEIPPPESQELPADDQVPPIATDLSSPQEDIDPQDSTLPTDSPSLKEMEDVQSPPTQSDSNECDSNSPKDFTIECDSQVPTDSSIECDSNVPSDSSIECDSSVPADSPSQCDSSIPIDSPIQCDSGAHIIPTIERIDHQPAALINSDLISESTPRGIVVRERNASSVTITMYPQTQYTAIPSVIVRSAPDPTISHQHPFH